MSKPWRICRRSKWSRTLLKELIDRLEAFDPSLQVWEDGAAWILYLEKFAEDVDLLALDSSLSWQQDSMKIFGKSVLLPRLTAWYGDSGTEYVYSGIRNFPRPWTSELAALRARLVESCRIDFNSVLANRYTDGNQHMGYHADNETEFGVDPIIASLSFGAQRRFLWKKISKGSDLNRIELAHGSLLLMGGTMQREFVHAVPKMRGVEGPRINLTFRRVVKGMNWSLGDKDLLSGS